MLRLPLRLTSQISPFALGSSYTGIYRGFCSESERFIDESDVVIVGGGPSGLASAIRLKQLAEKNQKDMRVVLIEKASEVGAHILSGAVIDPISLNELIPDWKQKNAPVHTEVTEDHMMFLTENSHYSLPLIPQLKNHGNYIISLSKLCRWLGQQAEELGVEIYPGCAATEVLYNEDGSVKGIATNDVGIAKDGSKKSTYEPGMELHAKATLFAEGCRGSLTMQIQERFNLREGVQPQTYGIGLKEVWKVSPESHKLGKVIHTLGWPLDRETYGGSFMYHWEDNQISVGFVVALDYRNPFLNPYKEFQRWKHHPSVREIFEGGECISYGARAISEGGYQSVPKLFFPGGALIGDCAGFLNVPRIKGTHTAMKSGILCADSLFNRLQERENTDKTILLDNYFESYKNSWLHDELYHVRNVRPSFQYGLYGGLLLSGLDTLVFRGRAPFTLSHLHKDDESLRPASESKPIDYPKPDGKISFDLLTNLARSNTYHEEDQPCHLKLTDPSYQVDHSLKVYDGPEQRFCPANVYEYIRDDQGNARFQINQSNCIHCKTCDIKQKNITWVPPEGGGGPIYNNM